MPGSPTPALPLRDRLADRVWRVRRAVLARRRLLAVVVAVLAVLSGLRATASPATHVVPLTVAARDLPAGATLASGDLRVVDVSRAMLPDGRIAAPVGRVLAGPMRRGEPVTDARLVGPALTAGRPGLTVTPLRLPDAAMAGLLRVGDRIDLLAVDAEGGVPAVLARDCPVLALPAADPGAGGTDGLTTTTGGGRLVVLGVPEAAVTSVSGAAVSNFLTFTYSG